MENQNESEKCCRNCKFFIRYYYKLTTKFHPAFGHCRMASKKEKVKRDCDICELWEPGVTKEERKETILTTLCAMSVQLASLNEFIQAHAEEWNAEEMEQNQSEPIVRKPAAKHGAAGNEAVGTAADAGIRSKK